MDSETGPLLQRRRLPRPQLRSPEIFRGRPARRRLFAEHRQPDFRRLFQEPIRPGARDGELRFEFPRSSKRCCAPRRRNGSRSRSTSTCRCFTWSTACSARFFPAARITATAAGPCDRHDVKLRDRVGAEHPLKADAGCRNTVFNALAQTGAEYVSRMIALGVRHFRVEFLNETPEQVARTIAKYRQLVARRNYRRATLARIEIVQPARRHARADGEMKSHFTFTLRSSRGHEAPLEPLNARALQSAAFTNKNIPVPAATNNPSAVPASRGR